MGLTMGVIEKIRAYVPYNAEEARDKAEMLRLMEENTDIFMRENDRAHMTASAWVVNQARDKVLMVYHNIYDSWS
ncbi:MAG: NUDIX hydrolase, partial [Oscillospiraceae bacterium]|nr:NUDIX hydrolase [Oscillospiraceae bacterium]